LRRFLTDRGKIRSRRKTGTCAKHQRRLAVPSGRGCQAGQASGFDPFHCWTDPPAV